jgi:hypothetical protein
VPGRAGRNTLAANAVARSVLGVEDKGYNYLSAFFTDPATQNRYPQWNEMVGQLVGQFRVQAARFPDDPNFDRMARQLSSESRFFADLWALHEIRDCAMTDVEVLGPGGMPRSFAHITLGFVERTDLRLMLYTPRAGTATADLEFQPLAAAH